MKKLLLLALILGPLLVRAQTTYTRMLSGVNYQRGTSYSLLPADTTRVTGFVNASAIAVCLSSPSSLCAGVPAGSGQFFGAGSEFSVYNQGTGTVTITCSGCTINLSATLVLTAGQSGDLYGDGTNFIAFTAGGGGGAVLPPPGVFSVTPVSLVFGSVAVGTTSPPQTVTLTNNSLVTVTGISVAVSGTNALDFTAATTCPTSLGPAGSCTVSVTFVPTISSETANLVVTDSDPSSPHTTTLTGSGFNGAVLSVNPQSIAFGPTLVGKPETQVINVCDTLDVLCRNSAPLPVTGITIFPAVDTVDSSNPFASASACPPTLQPGQTCLVTITFNPTVAGTYSNGSVKIASNGNTYVIPLTGTATAVTAPTLSSVAITPTTPTITNGATQQFGLVGTYSDSSTANLPLGDVGVDWSVTGAAAGTVTFDAGAVCTPATGFFAGSNPCASRTVTKGDLVGGAETAPFGDTLTCTDTLGDSFTYTAVFAASPTNTQFCYAIAKSTGSNTINLVQSGSSNMYGFDFQFTGATGVQDTGLPNGVGLINGGSATASVTTGNFTLASAGDLIISWMRDTGSTVFTNGGGYTYLGGSSGNGCNTNVTLCVEYLIGASSGANAATWTDSASTTTWKVGAMAITAGASQVATVNTNGVVTPTATGSTTVYGNSGYVLQKNTSCTSNASAVTTLSCTLPSNVGQDTIVVLVGSQDATSTVGTPTDTSGNIYTLSSAHTQGNGLTDYIFYSQGIVASGPNTVTEPWTGGGATTPSIQLFEINGAIGGVDTASAANTATALCQPSAITTSNTYDIGIGFAVVAAGGQIVQNFPQNAGDGRPTPQGVDAHGNGAVVLDTFATVSSAQPLYSAAAAGPCAMAEVWFKSKGSSTTLTVTGSAPPAYTRDNPPPASYVFYPGNVFTKPIPGVPTNHLQTNSDTIISNTFGGSITPSSTYATIWRYDSTHPFDIVNLPNYRSGCGDPIYYIKSVARQTGVARYQPLGVFFHGFAGATMMNGGGTGTGGDQAFSDWDQCTNGTGTNNVSGGTIYDFYTSGSQLTLSPVCNATTQAQAAANSNCWVVADGATMGFPQNEPNPLQVDTIGGFSSIGIAPMLGTLLNNELINGSILHRLIINIPCVGGAGVFPGIGGTNQLCSALGLSNTNRLVNGNTVFLDTGINCATVPLWQRGVCVALQVYGAGVSDTGSGQTTGMYVSRTDAQTPWILTNFNVQDPLMTWFLAQTTSCTSGSNCTGANGLQTFGSGSTPTEVVAPFFAVGAYLGHLHVLDPCVDKFTAGVTGACNPN